MTDKFRTQKPQAISLTDIETDEDREIGVIDYQLRQVEAGDELWSLMRYLRKALPKQWYYSVFAAFIYRQPVSVIAQFCGLSTRAIDKRISKAKDLAQQWKLEQEQLAS